MGEHLDIGFRLDMLVEEKVIVKLKHVEETPSEDHKRVQTYIRLKDVRIGLLITYGKETLSEGLSRIANKYTEE